MDCELTAKLFHFDKAQSEWIFKGVGKVTVKDSMVNMADPKINLPMLSHSITANLSLVMSEGSDRSWVYHAKPDLTDNVNRLVAIRFANSNDANTFKECIEKAKSDSKSVTESAPTENISAPPETPLKTEMDIPPLKEPELELIKDENEIKSEIETKTESKPVEQAVEEKHDAIAPHENIEPGAVKEHVETLEFKGLNEPTTENVSEQPAPESNQTTENPDETKDQVSLNQQETVQEGLKESESLVEHELEEKIKTLHTGETEQNHSQGHQTGEEHEHAAEKPDQEQAHAAPEQLKESGNEHKAEMEKDHEQVSGNEHNQETKHEHQETKVNGN
ncbi:hypothetical protein HK103_003467 [Boothiomyces macroporosus]|uniref:RanBD1 domain-containing protein n=1 Tax=Boothiomyces macroporosus TaxID=261099 RepID=A0AAD5UKB4_9FUNG|nr:hypothetical protein HK103_003467 [Boothiomyces macroporosus]